MGSVNQRTYQSEVYLLLKKLSESYGLQSEESLISSLFNSLSGECLNYTVTKKFPSVSSICGDMTPFQFSVSLSKNPKSARALRYVTEICRTNMMLPERVSLARKSIPVLLELIGAAGFQTKINEVIDKLLPQSRLMPQYPTFGIWFGVHHEAAMPPRLKIYCNLLWELGDPWLMFEEILQLLDIDSGEAVNNIRTSFGSQCRPCFVRIECTSSGIGGARLYLRGYELSRRSINDYLDKMGWDDFKREYGIFHEIVMGHRETWIPRSSILSMDLQGTGSAPNGIKLEAGPRYYTKDDEEIYMKIMEIAHELELDTGPYEQLLGLLSSVKPASGTMRFHDVIGIGSKQGIGTRLNIYLRPDIRRYFDSMKKV